MNEHKERLKERLDLCKEEILAADLAYKCFIEMSFDNKKWERVYEYSPRFFKLAKVSIQDEAYIAISKLFETRKNNNLITLEKVLNYAQCHSEKLVGKNYCELNQLICDLKRELDEKKDNIDKIMDLRDNVIAHNGKKWFEIKEEFESSKEEINELLEFSQEIINEIYNFVFNEKNNEFKYMSLEYGYKNDLNELMNLCLKKIDN